MHDENENEKKVSDVKWPNNSAHYEPGNNFFKSERRKIEEKKELPDKMRLIGVFLLIGAFVVAATVFFRATSSKLSGSVSGGAEQQYVNPFGADERFGGLFKAFETIFSGAGESVSGFGSMAMEVSDLAGDVGFLQENIISIVMQKKGDVLISRLESISGRLKKIQEEEKKLNAAADKLGSIASSSMNVYLSLKLDLLKAQKLVDSLLAWLKSTDPRHILVMFQNPSEIRPAGGFLGSYADMQILGGNIESFDIRDISDSDKELELKTIPPKPLQVVVKNWRAADANWFFDFPQSASTVIYAMESSALYADKKILFDGAIAVSPKIIEDILEIIGPVTVGKITFTSENFLVEIQKIVQAGQATNATYPKGILKELGAAILEKFLSGAKSDTENLVGMVSDWVARKDVMAYFKDPKLENFADEYKASGKMYEFPSNFFGDYVALVEANIGGGKSDLFVKRAVAFESQINTDGTVNDRVVVAFDHQGDKSGYWWYKVPSQDYLQLFVPPSSRLTNFSGGVEKKITAPLDYKKNRYLANPLVLEIESSTEKVFSYPAVSSHKELGKKVFSAWSKLKPGEKGQVVFSYTHRLFLPPAESQVYSFVFEKQAGTRRNYTLNISAPPGFIFEENNLPVFEYASDDPPGRLVINLTLKKLVPASP